MSNIPPPSGAPLGPPPAQGGYGGGPSPVPSGSAGLLSPRWGITEGPPAGWAPKQKMVAGILGILLGAWGIHSFYLGNTKKGIIQIVVSIVTCGIGGLWGLIEGIFILMGNEQARTDAYGVPLTES